MPSPLARFLFVIFITITTHEIASARANPGPGDWGDAPQGALAYPDLGVVGEFPTVYAIPVSGYIWHGTNTAWFGASWDDEMEGNAGAALFPPYDLDECSFNDHDVDECDLLGPDAGLTIPEPATISSTGGFTACNGCKPSVVWADCATAVWGVDVDINVVNNTPSVRYVNVLADWDGSGNWAGLQACSAGTFGDGETEDYLIPIDPTATAARPTPSRILGEIQSVPNPFNPQTELRFEGVDRDGTLLPSGVYYAEIRSQGDARTQKLLMLK